MVLAALLVFTTPISAQRERQVTVAPGQTTQVISDTMAAGYDLPFSYGRVYHALVAGFADIKIVTTERDSLAGQVDLGLLSVHRRRSVCFLSFILAPRN